MKLGGSSHRPAEELQLRRAHFFVVARAAHEELALNVGGQRRRADVFDRDVVVHRLLVVVGPIRRTRGRKACAQNANTHKKQTNKRTRFHQRDPSCFFSISVIVILKNNCCWIIKENVGLRQWSVLFKDWNLIWWNFKNPSSREETWNLNE